MSENISAIQSGAKIINAECKSPEANQYMVKKGDSLWNVAKSIIKENGEKTTNKRVIAEMTRLAQLNGYQDFDSFSKNFWKPGPGYKMKIKTGCAEEVAPKVKSPKAKVTVEEVKAPPKASVPAKVEAPVVKAPEEPIKTTSNGPSQDVQEALKAPKAPDNSPFPSALDTGYKAPAAETKPQAAPPKGLDTNKIKAGIDKEIAKEAPKSSVPATVDTPVAKAPEEPIATTTNGPSQDVQPAPKAPDNSPFPSALDTGYKAPAAKDGTTGQGALTSFQSKILGKVNNAGGYKAPEAAQEPIVIPETPKATPTAVKVPTAEPTPLTDALKGKSFNLPVDAQKGQEPKLPDVTDGLFPAKPEAKPLLPWAKKTTLTPEAKARLQAGAGIDTAPTVEVTDSAVTKAVEGVTLKKAGAGVSDNDGEKAVPTLPKVILPSQATEKAPVVTPEKPPVAPVTAPTVNQEPPVANAQEPVVVAPPKTEPTAQQLYQLRIDKEASDTAATAAKARADADAAKAQAAAETDKLLAELAKKNAAKTEPQQTPKVPEAPKTLTRPQNATFGDDKLWSTDGIIYQKPDGSNYGKIKSGGDNLYYDMQNYKIVSRNNSFLVSLGLKPEMGEVDIADLDPDITPDIANEIDKLGRH